MRLALGTALVAAMYVGLLALLVAYQGWTGVLLFVGAVVAVSVLGVGAFKVTVRGRANAPRSPDWGRRAGRAGGAALPRGRTARSGQTSSHG